MPWLSGIDLLSKIMSHKSLQNIPVISEYISYTIFFSMYKKHNITPRIFNQLILLTATPGELYVQ